MFPGLQSVSSLSFRALSTGLQTPFNAFIRHASKKAKGSSKNGRDTIGKRLGPKVMDDYTLYALAPGIVRFVRGRPENKGRQGGRRGKLFLRIDPPEPHRAPSIARKLERQAQARYRGPILHAPL